MQWEAIVWFVLMLIFLMVEANTVSMVSAWFAVGSLGALIISLLGGELWIQGVVFVTVSAVLLILLRPLARKHFTPKLVKTNVEAVVGQTGPVIVAIDNVLAEGRVKLGGMEWAARSTDGQPIPLDTLVTVDRVEGVKVFVTAAESKEHTAV